MALAEHHEQRSSAYAGLQPNNEALGRLGLRRHDIGLAFGSHVEGENS
jgi:hypothetical protein